MMIYGIPAPGPSIFTKMSLLIYYHLRWRFTSSAMLTGGTHPLKSHEIPSTVMFTVKICMTMFAFMVSNNQHV
jgi:hypothetical protein